MVSFIIAPMLGVVVIAVVDKVLDLFPEQLPPITHERIE